MYHTLVLDLTTSDISAIADKDYEAKYQLPVTVEAGQTHLVPIEIRDDTRFESDEAFLVKLNGSAVGEGIRVMEIWIEDDDGKTNDQCDSCMKEYIIFSLFYVQIIALTRFSDTVEYLLAQRFDKCDESFDQNASNGLKQICFNF